MKAAAGLVSRGTAAEAVSASVSSLLTSSLRAMIMTRLSMLAVTLLTVSVGVAATVMAQNTPQPGKRAGMSAEMSPAPQGVLAGAITPVFEYEIQIAKDWVPVTDMTKVRIVAGQAAKLDTPAGTFEVRFEPRLEPPAADKHSSNGGLDPRQLATLMAALESQPLLLRDLQVGERDRLLAALRALQDAQASSADVTESLNDQERLRLFRDRLQRLGSFQPGSTKDDHEKRLAEIEKKLERILSVLDRLPEANTKPPGLGVPRKD